MTALRNTIALIQHLHQPLLQLQPQPQLQLNPLKPAVKSFNFKETALEVTCMEGTACFVAIAR